MNCNNLNLELAVEILLEKDIEKLNKNHKETFNSIYSHVTDCVPCYNALISILNKKVRKLNSIDIYFTYSRNMRILNKNHENNHPKENYKKDRIIKHKNG